MNNPFLKFEKYKYYYSLFRLSCTNLLGQEVVVLVNQYKNAEKYIVDFDASNLASRIYFYQLSAGNFISTKKMIVLK